jgi:hypothetical protein
LKPRSAVFKQAKRTDTALNTLASKTGLENPGPLRMKSISFIFGGLAVMVKQHA